MRKNTGVTLTPAGQLLLSRSESITREMKNMVNEISGMSSEAVVEVSFGFPSLIGFTFMSGMINKFKEVPKRRFLCMKRNCLVLTGNPRRSTDFCDWYVKRRNEASGFTC